MRRLPHNALGLVRVPLEPSLSDCSTSHHLWPAPLFIPTLTVEGEEVGEVFLDLLVGGRVGDFPAEVGAEVRGDLILFVLLMLEHDLGAFFGLGKTSM